MMMLLYRLLFLPGLILGLPHYILRMWRRGGYRKGFENRFGILRNVPPKRAQVKRIWIQAVSVGELNAIAPMLKQLAANPSLETVVTTTTSTGIQVLADKLAPLTVWNGVFPLDFWLFSSRAWKALQPDLAVLMEGELWPEHIHQATLRGVPVILANARISNRSWRRHWKSRRLVRAYLNPLARILAASKSDQQRFRELAWIPPENIQLMGNLKLDVDQDPPPSAQERERLQQESGFGDGEVTLLLGSSTWPGEEQALLGSYLELRQAFPQLRLLVVPRHAERKHELSAMVKSFGVRWHFRTDGRQAPADTDVYIADTTGELRMLTRFCDLVFIGKSLPPNAGGQTPIEAAALGKAMVFGPDMSNFRDIARRLLDAGAALRIEGAHELTPALRQLLADPAERAAMGGRGFRLVQASRGATERAVREIRRQLGA